MEPTTTGRGTPLATPRSTRTSPATSSRSSSGSSTTSTTRPSSSSPGRPKRRVHQVPPQAGRLRPAPARRADDPRQAAVRRRDAGADGGLRRRDRAVRAAEQGPHHHPAEHPDPPHAAARRRGVHPDGLRRPPLLAARAAATRCATSPATRGPASSDDELFDPTPYAAAYVRYFVRHPTTQAMPRKVKTAFTADRRRPRDHRHPRRRVPPAHPRRQARLRDPSSAAAPRSCRASPRSSTTSSAPTTASTCKVTEAVLRIFDRQDWLRVNRARARIKVFVDKFGIDELRRQVEEELQGDWVAERDFSVEPLPVPRRRGGQRAAPRPAGYALAQRRPVASSSASRTSNVRPQRQEGFSTVEVAVPRGDLTPEQFRGLAADHARLLRRLRPHDRRPEPRPALGARRGGLRRLAAAGRARARRARRDRRSSTSSAARAPTPASSASPARWASTPRCASGCARWRSPTR